MTTTLQPAASRRGFLKSTALAGAGLVIGVHLPLPRARAGGAAPFAPNAFIRIAPDDTVTVLSKHIEFGQGPFTGLATIVAEELDADWSQMRAVHAPADADLYANLAFGVQGTGGSTAIANSWDQLRKAGAEARALLVRAAADRWQVEPGEVTVAKGVLRHGDRSLTFGDVASEAAALEIRIDEPALKDPKDFSLIGTDLPKLDTLAKTTGRADYTLDQAGDGMLTVLVAHPPRFGGKVASFDDSAARAVKGVVDVVQIPEGVAVLAEGFWAAKKGRDALEVSWDDSAAETRGSEDLFAAYQEKLAEPGLVAHGSGDAAAALEGAASVVEMTYEFPFLAHAPMETNDCVIQRDDDGCTLRLGSQLQTVDQNVVAEILGIAPEKVRIETLLAGGSFGRRATPTGDMAAEAANLLKAYGGDRPLKVVWTREDDIKGGRYRPLYVEKVRGAVDANGDILAWEHRIVGQSILVGTPFEQALVEDGIDKTSVEGASDLPYAMPNRRIEVHNTEVGVPVLWWRSVGHTHTAYSTETFFDLLARAAGRDPVEMRKALLQDQPRHLGVLERVAELADWGGPVPEGRARGVAVHKSFGSFVAQIAEVSLGEDGMPVVHKVWCAVDCGVAINPNVIRAQMEGGIGYGLGAALHDEITLVDGYVQQANFDDYPSIRITEMPEVEVAVVASEESPTGVGEPGVPPIAPAVANAVLALTGEVPGRLPFARSLRRA